MQTPQAPMSLVNGGRLILYDIYRTAKLSERSTALVKGKASDQFPPVIPNNPWDGSGVLPNSQKALANGDVVSDEQWPSLQVWHAGLSCQLFLKPRQGILCGLEDENFLDEFNDPSRRENKKNETGEYRIVLVFELRKGAAIPNDIGIEVDGENHICLYPIGANLDVSDIEGGLASFTINSLMSLQSSWRPFAVFQVRARGFVWPIEFPPDSDVFPFRLWLTTIINYGDSDIAVNASSHTEEYIDGSLSLFKYLSKMLTVARSYAFDCSFDHLEMNLCISKALLFALNANKLAEKNDRTNFMMKSSTLNEDDVTERAVVSTASNDFETISRRVLVIDGGRSVITAAATIEMLFIDARLAVPIALPFKVVVDGVEVLFDEIEPSPVAEGFESDVGDCDKCEEIVQSFSRDPVSADSVDICIEASLKKSFSVKLTEEERTKFMQECETCFGYTTKQVRCKNRRKSLQGEKVWCYHHKSQEREYRGFCTYRDRPEICDWWEGEY